jgi:3',5'-cyclic AMP phosphodiesterase CpdA
MAVIAHLSDTHLRVDNPHRLDRLRRVLDDVRTQPRIDALVVTGDLADHGLDAEYALLKAELPTTLPVLVTTGNHDDRDAFERALGPRNSVLDVDGVRIVGLDSLVTGDHGDLDDDAGLLDPATLAFARDAASEAPGPVVLAFHHPPVGIGHPVIDAILLSNTDDLRGLVESTPNIVALLTGHVHTAHTARFATVPVMGAPGVASALDMVTTDRIRTDESACVGYVVHRITGSEISSRFVTLS